MTGRRSLTAFRQSLRNQEQVVAVSISTMLVMMGQGILGPVLPLFTVELGFGAAAAGARLVVARLEPGDLEIDRLAIDDRCDGIEERKGALAGQFLQGVGQARRREGTRRNDDAAPGARRQRDDLFPTNLDQRLIRQRLLNGGAEPVAIDSEGGPGGDAVGIGGDHDQRSDPAHFRVQQTDGAARVIGPERV